ncbi:virulence factor TspB C-terminal domain-related protein [Variovorax sp. tm]|uniref:virulence factor TspB C-terminal domain-related protein n=1 Tax=Variovorax atrisoli TaxID=3394203 RepID=UPI003A806C19
MSEYCKNNPKALQCTGTQSSFGGACASGFSAKSDDAVVNAMAEETFRQNCKVNPDDASQILGRTEAAKTGNQTGTNPNNSSVAVGAGNFDSSDAIGSSGQCVGDQTVTVLRWTATLPFSRVCSSLDMLGLALLAVSSLLAARIVARG